VTYRTNPIKRSRRTKAEIDALREAMYEIAREDHPVTVRQVFYRMVSAGLVDKREAEYKNTVARLLVEMRKDGELPYRWIADNTRWVRVPTTYSSLGEALRATAAAYRRSLWASRPERVEVWCEKEALAGVLVEETRTWQVPLYVVRGYASLSYLWEAAQETKAVGKPTRIYYFGDHDPSGLDIERVVRERLEEFAPDVDLTVTRAAVTPEQIEGWGLPTRPTKRSDSRAKGFNGGSVELDAIMPRQLRALTRDCIERHVDPWELDALQRTEEEERSVLASVADVYGKEAWE
jgi:hypothetical protein